MGKASDNGRVFKCDMKPGMLLEKHRLFISIDFTGVRGGMFQVSTLGLCAAAMESTLDVLSIFWGYVRLRVARFKMQILYHELATYSEMGFAFLISSVTRRLYRYFMEGGISRRRISCFRSQSMTLNSSSFSSSASCATPH